MRADNGWCGAFLGVLLGGLAGIAPASAKTLSSMDACLLQALEQADDGARVGELKAQCEVVSGAQAQPQVLVKVEDQVDEGVTSQPAPNEASMVPRRMQAEQATRSNPFVLSPHKLNYVLLASYNDTPNFQIYNIPESDFDRVEMKFQLSFKMPVFEDLLGSDVDLYMAYTNLSFWQAYNRQISSPFRETVHEPEAFLVMPNDWEIFGWKNSLLQIGAVHQSNGQGGYLSRSWNRVYANFIFEKDNFLLGFKPWHRVKESNDDNPDISDYYGNYELTGLYKKGEHTFSLMTRNLFDRDGRETYQLDWSFPLYKHWRGYMQYFNGFGESLIDYNAESQRIGFGLQLSDWL